MKWMWMSLLLVAAQDTRPSAEAKTPIKFESFNSYRLPNETPMLGDAMTTLLVILALQDPDIRCKGEVHAPGNATIWFWTLTIEQGTWEYTYGTGSFSQKEPRKIPKTPREITKTTGTYTFDGDLAVFTDKADTLRFGVNFGRVEGEPHFNAFFPAKDGAFQYHRRWYKKVEGAWTTAADITIALKITKMDDYRCEVHVKGEKSGDRFEGDLVYVKENRVYALKDRPKDWLPAHLIPNAAKSMIVADSGVGTTVRGFAPDLAK